MLILRGQACVLSNEEMMHMSLLIPYIVLTCPHDLLFHYGVAPLEPPSPLGEGDVLPNVAEG